MIGNSQQIIQWLFQQKDLEKKYEIKEHRQKRSLSQNAYCWELIGQIADSLRKSKEDVYFQMLKDYGQSEIISVRSDININGYFKYFEVFGTGTVNGKEFTHYKVYKGSSEFDTREMSIFIDGVIQEAQALDIQTLTPSQIAELKTLEEQRLSRKVTYRDFSQAIRQFFSTLYRNHPVFALFFAPSQGRKAVFSPSRHFAATALYCFYQDYLPLWKGRLSRF